MEKLKKTILIGGSSDIGQSLKKILVNHEILEINSKDLDLNNLKKVKNYKINFIPENIIFLSAYNKPKKFIKYLDSEIHSALNINFFSLVFLLKLFIKKIIKNKKKCNIVLITSLYSQKGREGRFLYSVCELLKFT